MVLLRAPIKQIAKNDINIFSTTKFANFFHFKLQASQLLAQQWADKLAEKRRLENLENHKRYLRMQDKLQRQQEDLKLYLNERDQRIQRYLEELTFKKVPRSNIYISSLFHFQ